MAVVRRTLSRYGTPAFVLASLLLLAVGRSELILNAAESLLLTPLVLLLHPQAPGSFWNAEIGFLWLAFLGWGGAVFVTVRLLTAHEPPRLFRFFASLAPSTGFSRTIAIGVVAVGIGAPLLAPVDPYAQGDLMTTRLLPPGTSGVVLLSSSRAIREDETSIVRRLRTVNRWLLFRDRLPVVSPDRPIETTFLLGTDAVGRDVLSRLLYGTRVSVGIGIAASVGALALGLLLGLAAGMGGRRTDLILMWIVDVFLALPSLFLVLVLAYLLGGSIIGVIAVLALSGWMRVARVVRGEIIHLRERDFISAARLLGQSPVRIARRHLLPNLAPVLLSTALLLVSDSVLAESALGFLGFGVQPPIPSWGNILGDSLAHLERAWWLACAPGIVLSLWMISLHRTADSIQGTLRG